MTLNTRQHTTHEEKRADPPPSGGTPKRSILDDLRALAREEGGGVGALYRGIEPAVIGTVTSQAVYNWWYAKLRGSYAKKYGENPGALGSLAVAAAAGSVNVLMTIPIWTVCVRMQAERAGADGEKKRRDAGDDAAEGKKTQTRWGRGTAARARDGTGRRSSNPAAMGAGAAVIRKKTFFETTRAVWEESGASGFWRGVVPSLAMVANPALQYAFYESVADRFRRAKGRRRRVTSEGGSRARPLDASTAAVSLSAWEVFAAASAAKVFATTLTYPALLVKSRLQAGGEAADPKMRYDGVVDAVRRIWEEEGCWAFYRGMGTKMTQTVFAAALMFAAKEEIAKSARRLLRKR
jgi:adenine nucleotide transporter 17